MDGEKIDGQKVGVSRAENRPPIRPKKDEKEKADDDREGAQGSPQGTQRSRRRPFLRLRSLILARPDVRDEKRNEKKGGAVDSTSDLRRSRSATRQAGRSMCQSQCVTLKGRGTLFLEMTSFKMT